MAVLAAKPNGHSRKRLNQAAGPKDRGLMPGAADRRRARRQSNSLPGDPRRTTVSRNFSHLVLFPMDSFSAVDFLTDGVMGHASYILLILSSLMRRMFLLRAFFIASSIAGIAYSLYWLGDFVGVFWETLLLLVNVTQLALLASKDARARFTEEEAEFVESWLSGGTPSSRRALLNMGRWETLEAGSQLTTRGERPHDLVFLSRGEADVSIAGLALARISEGHFIGEMSLLGDELASADVRLAVSSRVWRINRSRLDEARMRQPDLFGIIELALALSLRAKLIAANDRLVTQATPANPAADGLANLPA